MASDRPIATFNAPVQSVLVVDDDPSVGQSLKSILQAYDFTVTIAKDGGQAHAAFVMRRPDVVLLDLILPKESGFEVCQRMKRADPTVPVIVVSVMDTPEARDLANRVGADGYVVKPYEIDDLFQTIAQVAEDVWEKHHQDPAQRAAEGIVRFRCRCGKRFKVSATHRGKVLTCPACGEPVTVPQRD